MRIRVLLDGREASGGTPMLHHSEVLADPISPEGRSVAEIAGKRKKTEADHEELARREWLGGMYYDETLGPVLPTWNFVRSMQEAAKLSRLGKTIERGVFPENEFVEIRYDGPRDLDSMWKARTFALRKGVGISGRRVMRTRPIFREWEVDLVLVVDPFVVDYETITKIATQAGRYIGVCDFRSGRYGRYLATCELLTTETELLEELSAFQIDADSTMLKTVKAAIEKDEAAHLSRNGKERQTVS